MDKCAGPLPSFMSVGELYILYLRMESTIDILFMGYLYGWLS